MHYFQGEFEERCHSTGGPNDLSFFTATWSLIFLLLNIPGNLLVILAVALDPYKNLRTPFNYLMASLACADLLVGTVTEPLSVYIHLKEGLDANLTLEELETLHMSYFISCTASVLSLGTIAVERYLAIRNPHTYRNKLTGKRVLVTIAVIWTISLLLPVLYLEVGFITYAFIFANTALVAVFVITCFIYGLMLKKFYSRRMKYTEKTDVRPVSMAHHSQLFPYQNKKQNSPLPQTRDQSVDQASLETLEIQDSPKTQLQSRDQGTALGSEIAKGETVKRDGTAEQTAQSTYRGQRVSCNSQVNQFAIEPTSTSNAIYNSCQAMEQKITRMFLVVLIAMLCCYGPSTVFIYVMSFCETCKCKTLHWFRDLQFLFVIMNSSVNFYCYAIRSPRFRNAFKYMLRLKQPADIPPAALRAVNPANLSSS